MRRQELMQRVQILLVENNELHTDLVCRAFSTHSLETRITVASGLHDARLTIRRQKPDLLIIDRDLPDGRGDEILSDFDAMPDFPVIIMSDDESKPEDYDSGNRAFDYIDKSRITPTELPHIAERALRGWQVLLEREEAREARQESEDRYRRIFDTIQDLYLEIGFDGEIIEVSPSIQMLSKYTRDDLLGRNIIEFTVRPDVVAEFLALLQKNGQVEDFEVLLMDRDRKILCGSTKASIVYDDKEQPAYIAASMTDVTEKKKALDDLEKSRRLYQELIESQGEGLGIVDINENFTFVNPAAEKIFGVGTGELVGRNIRDFVTNEEFSKILEQTERRKKGSSNSYDMEITRPDGRRRILLMTATPRFTEKGEFLGAFGIFRDITERRQATQAVRESEERYRSLIELLPHGVGVLQNMRIVFANTAAVRMLGYDSADELIGLDALIPLSDSEKERVLDMLRDIRSGKSAETVHYVTKAKKKNGQEFPVEAFVTAIQHEGEIALQIFMMDITEREKAEEEREALEEELRQAQKMESIGSLAAGIAHDFNNLLSPIIGYSEVALMNLQEKDPLREDLRQIHTAADRAKSLTQQLLAFGRKQVLNLKVADLNQIISESKGMLRRLIREDVHIEMMLSKDPGSVKADVAQIQQLIMNLVLNASDAMDQGGSISIETEKVVIEKEYADLQPDLNPGRYVVMTFSDTGRGMDAETIARIYDPFFTTKAKGHGTGLGLATVHGIVKQHGGHIAVESQVGIGSTFRVYLPSVQEEVEVEAKPSEEPGAAKTGETILIVEDDEPVRNLAVRILEGHGFKVISARDGDEAIYTAGKYEGGIDLLVTDVIMPGMNGRELFMKLFSKNRDLEVIYISGYSDDVVAQQGILEEGINFLQKPFSVKDLIRKVRYVLDSRACS